MNDQTKMAIRRWVEMDGGDTNRTAKWMRDNLNVAGIAECRNLIKEALNPTPEAR